MNIPMSDIATTKMTSKGQVVIPEEIREYMHLESGVKFVVMASGDSIILKRITPIPKKDVKRMLEATRALAKKYKFKEEEIPEIISEVRKEARRKKAKKDGATTKRS